MMTNEDCNGVGRDTKMCGDPKMWYPMRVTYGREMKVKAELDSIGIECFVPMTYKLLVMDSGNTRKELVPAIRNLIFVRSSQERISELKRKNEMLEPLRYMLAHTNGDEPKIMTVRDREIAEALAPELAARGLFLVGLDIIGDWLTEINVTSPTCFREITDQSGFNVAGMFIDELEKALLSSQH